MLDTADPELCSIITNVCKPPKHVDFPETEKAFRFVWFEEFPWICFSWWEDRNYCLPCVSFGHKDVGKSFKKKISNMAKRSKCMQKNRNVPTGTHRGKYYFIDFSVNANSF